MLVGGVQFGELASKKVSLDAVTSIEIGKPENEINAIYEGIAEVHKKSDANERVGMWKHCESATKAMQKQTRDLSAPD